MNALFSARITHTRTRPRAHFLAYRVPYIMLDLSAPPRLRLFSRNRWNLFSLRDADYGDGHSNLDSYAGRVFAEAGLAIARIRLLTTPRVLGWGFNPISLWFGHDAAGALRAVLYEVNNTFGQRHSYLFPIEPGATAPLQHECAKKFYVSPFMGMDQHYAFTLTPPGPALGLHIAVSDAAGPLLRATMAAPARPLTDTALLAQALAMPWAGLKIITTIHWEALKLWIKRVPLVPRPPAPATAVTMTPPKTEPAA